jgi:hypothetical protein
VENLCIVHVQQQVDDDAKEKNKIMDEDVNLPNFLNVDRKLIDGKEDNRNFGAFSISLRDASGL